MDAGDEDRGVPTELSNDVVAAKLPVVLVPVSVLRQAVSSVDLPTCEAGAVSLPVSTKPTSVAGQFPGPDPAPAAAIDAVLLAV